MIIRNKTSCPKDFELTRFDTVYKTYVLGELKKYLIETFLLCSQNKGDVSFKHPKHMFARKRKLIFSGIYFYFNLPIIQNSDNSK